MTRLPLALLALVAITSGCGRQVAASCDAAGASGESQLSTWTHAYNEMLSTHPASALEDLYKLTHQGIRGSEHAVGDPADAAAWMSREVATLDTLPATIAEPLLEPLPPDGRFVRVNLRPFMKANGNIDSLVVAFVATANKPASDTSAFSCAEVALTGLRKLPAGLTVDSIKTFFALRRAQNFPAAHHSALYDRAYRPAYRVVAKDLATTLTRSTLSPP